MEIAMLNALIDIYSNWLEKNNIKAGCAFELSCEDFLTAEQQSWLERFIKCYDYFEARA
jgi:hypothetical protein